jgi:hypothetical protein
MKWGRKRTHIEFRRGNLLENDHLEDQKGDGRIKLRWNLGKIKSGRWMKVVHVCVQ